eukprot:TRINITY_DN4194_c0_g1_i1.p1 TRINITY_DN4194_c0_g1~~TRINITY_DN4194_c0_g1_i1.p1  ORF type:complete len:420 (-),score=62.27 TRINITY_DN4194_c0_g1_i1:51-1310(-)
MQPKIQRLLLLLGVGAGIGLALLSRARQGSSDDSSVETAPPLEQAREAETSPPSLEPTPNGASSETPSQTSEQQQQQQVATPVVASVSQAQQASAPSPTDERPGEAAGGWQMVERESSLNGSPNSAQDNKYDGGGSEDRTATTRHQRAKDWAREIGEPLRVDRLQVAPGSRVIIVGDVHGCITELRELLGQVGFNRQAGDNLVFVGDLVAKGPSSAEVIDLAIENGAHAVIGNHDWTVLRLARAIREQSESDWHRARSRSEHRQLAQTLTKQQLEYLMCLPHVLEVPEYNLAVVHAGLTTPLDRTSSFDAMHMRNVVGSSATEDISAGVAWAQEWRGPPFVVFGHDALRGLQQYENSVGLDTGCVYGGALSCYVVPKRTVHQVRAQREYSKPSKSSPLQPKLNPDAKPFYPAWLTQTPV